MKTCEDTFCIYDGKQLAVYAKGGTTDTGYKCDRAGTSKDSINCECMCPSNPVDAARKQVEAPTGSGVSAPAPTEEGDEVDSGALAHTKQCKRTLLPKF